MDIIHALQKFDSIQIVDSIESWKKGIELSLDPLLKQNIITPNYIQQCIQKSQDLNFYYLLAPGIGMPHSRPEDGVNETALSLLIIKNGIDFDGHNFSPIYILLGLAAKDNSSHIDILMNISELFSIENIIDQLIKAENKNMVISIISKYLKGDQE